MAKARPIYHERIIQDPDIMVGKPVVKGTRIPVELVSGTWRTTRTSTRCSPPTPT